MGQRESLDRTFALKPAELETDVQMRAKQNPKIWRVPVTSRTHASRNAIDRGATHAIHARKNAVSDFPSIPRAIDVRGPREARRDAPSRAPRTVVHGQGNGPTGGTRDIRECPRELRARRVPPSCSARGRIRARVVRVAPWTGGRRQKRLRCAPQPRAPSHIRAARSNKISRSRVFWFFLNRRRLTAPPPARLYTRRGTPHPRASRRQGVDKLRADGQTAAGGRRSRLAAPARHGSRHGRISQQTERLPRPASTAPSHRELRR